MSSYTQEQYDHYKDRMKEFSEKYNQDTGKAVEFVTGFDEKHCAYRYVKIHGAVELMGGWANCSYWMQNHAANYFQTCEKLALLLNQTINQVKDKSEREKLKKKMEGILDPMLNDESR